MIDDMSVGEMVTWGEISFPSFDAPESISDIFVDSEICGSCVIFPELPTFDVLTVALTIGVETRVFCAGDVDDEDSDAVDCVEIPPVFAVRPLLVLVDVIVLFRTYKHI